MPIITEIIEENNFMTTYGGNTEKLKQWMHLNHIINCKTIACKTYKMVQAHLLKLYKINNSDIILIPKDYELGSYSDAILTIVCAKSELCNVCLKLLDHLSCHKRYCDCNNYKEICFHQLHLRQAIEKSPISSSLMNKYNIGCSISTKKKIKSLGKYHYEVVKIMQGLKDGKVLTDNTVDNLVSNQTLSQCNMKAKALESFTTLFDNDDTETINNADKEIVSYKPKPLESYTDTFTFSDEDFIGGSDSDIDSNFDEVNDNCFLNYFGNIKFVSSGSSALSSDMVINIDSDDSSLDIQLSGSNSLHVKENVNGTDNNSADCLCPLPALTYNTADNTSIDYTHTQTCKNFETFESQFDLKHTLQNGPLNIENKTQSENHTKLKVNSEVAFSDESFINGGSESSSDDGHAYEQFYQSSSSLKKRKSKNIQIPMLSDESLIAYSDECDEDTTGLSSNYYTTSFTDASTSRISQADSHKLPDTDKLKKTNILDDPLVSINAKKLNHKLIKSSPGTTSTSLQDTSGFASQCSDMISSNEGEDAHSQLSSAAVHCKDHTLDCWYCGIKENDSKSENFTDVSLTHLHEVFSTSAQETPKPNKPVNKIITKSPQVKKVFGKKSTQISNTVNAFSKIEMYNGDSERDIQVTSGDTTPTCLPTKLTSTNTKASSLGDINYSYIRNVLSQHLHSSTNAAADKRKHQTNKPTPRKYKKKMKLYDTSSWIESSNYFQLCNSNMKKC